MSNHEVVCDQYFYYNTGNITSEFVAKVTDLVRVFDGECYKVSGENQHGDSDGKIDIMMDTLVTDVRRQAGEMQQAYVCRFHTYSERQQRDFHLWIVDVVNRYRENVTDGEIDPSMYAPLLMFIVKYANERSHYQLGTVLVVDMLSEGRLPPRSRLTGFKQYLKTAEAKRIIAREENTVTRENYTIYSVDKVKKLAKAYESFIHGFSFLNWSHSAKKQKMTTDNK